MEKDGLMDLGLTEEQAEACMKVFQDELKESLKDYVPKKDFVPLSRLNSVIEERNAERTKSADLETKLAEMKDAADQIEQLKSKLQDKESEHESDRQKWTAESERMKIDFAVERTLSSAKARNPKVVMALMDDFMKTAKLKEDGTVEGLDEEIGKIREKESYLFEGVKTGRLSGYIPPGSASGEATIMNRPTLETGLMKLKEK